MSGLLFKLKTRFFKCLIEVKNILFRAHCMCFYASQQWCNYSTSAINRLKVAYNDAYRILHGMPRYHSARESQIYYNIDSFYALCSVKLLINLLNAVTYHRTFGLKCYCLLIASMILYTMIIIVAFCL